MTDTAQRQALIDLLATAEQDGAPIIGREQAAALIDGPLASVIEALAVANEPDIKGYHVMLEAELDALHPAWLGTP